MNNFKLKIVASNKVFFDGLCQSLTLPYMDGGTVSFLAHHQNCVFPIESGEMKVKDDKGEVVEAFIGNGFLEFFDNEALVLCVSAELPEEIDKRRAKEAKIRAIEELRQQRSQVEYNLSKANLLRAMARIQVKNKYNGK